jgi:RNA polymerase sigma factor (sigma-70 family)
MDEPPIGQTVFQLRAAQAGDRVSLEDLLRRYRPRVHRAVAIALGNTSSQDADIDDAVQEVLVAAYGSLANYAPRSDASFMSWLMGIVVHKVRDRRRREQRQKRGGGQVQALDDLTSSSGDLRVPSPDPTVSQIVRAREIEDAELQALAQLPEERRALIVERDVLGMSYEEMAQKRGYETPDVMRALHSRARRKLGELLRRFDERGEARRTDG